MKKYSRKLRHVLWFSAAILLSVYLFWGYKYQLVYNHGTSMRPTYSDGEWMVVEKRSALGKGWVPDKFDVIVVGEGSDNLCKRVIGTPGDRIQIEDGHILLNGLKLEDPFGKGRVFFILTDEEGKDLRYWGTREKVIRYVDNAEEHVPEGFIWVIGDDREVSWFGLVPIKEIKALVVL